MDASIIVAAFAGASGAGLLIGGRALSLRLDPRPCWQKNDCSIRRGDPEACHVCPIYVFRDQPAEAFVTPELRLPALRTFATETAEAA